jgi:FkbM family methyltransferase
MKFFKNTLARNRRSRVVRRLMAWLLDLYHGYENYSYDFHNNGEQRVLRVLAQNIPVKNVFDVGANTGEWSTMAVRTFSNAQVHAFEIVPQTGEIYRENTRTLDRIKFNSVGLSDQEGVEKVYFSPGWSPIATCVPDFAEAFHHIETESISVSTITGDQYCRQNNIDEIDFLKIDVEGFEHKVLKGFSGMLSRKAIRVVQFEYGYVNIASRFLLKDYYDLLTSMGMVIGKIYPDYVDFRPYNYRHEDFMGPNFLAVRDTETDLIARLRL